MMASTTAASFASCGKSGGRWASYCSLVHCAGAGAIEMSIGSLGRMARFVLPSPFRDGPGRTRRDQGRGRVEPGAGTLPGSPVQLLEVLAKDESLLMPTWVECILCDLEDPAAAGSVLSGPNEARLGISKPYRSQSVRLHPFTVVSEAVVMLVLPSMSRSGWAGRSHSLWSCDAHVENRFSWYETAFMTTPMMTSRSVMEPYHHSSDAANEALSPVKGVQQAAWPFELDRSDLSEFVDRWLGWFGAAAQGSLSKSSMMPEKKTAGTWRRGVKRV